MADNAKKTSDAASPSIKGLIFDMDGTVIDSIQQDYRAWTQAFEPYGATFTYQDYAKESGAKGEEIAKNHADVSDEEASKITEHKDEIFEKIIEKEGLKSMPHIQPILEQARQMGLKVALATGSKEDKLNLVFEQVKLRHFFDELVTADHVNKGKPDPEVFQKAAEKLGLKPHEVIVWEDATLGVQAAKNAHMRCVCITTTQKGDRQGLEEADVIIDAYEGMNLKDLIRKLSS